MTQEIKTLFMGTPQFGATILRRLAQALPVVGVVTQPDRPAGRRNILTPPPVKVAAQELGLPVLQLERLRTPEAQAQLQEFAAGAEVFVVASFGMILPQAVLDMPPLKCLNVHGSLLPAYRGASPVAQALLDGLTETGVTIMLMEKGLDTGPMLSRVVVPVAPDETQPGLMHKLAEAGAELLIQTLPRWASGEITPEPQNPQNATHTGIIKKEAGQIDWREPAVIIERKSRAYDPWPGIFTFWNGQLLKLGPCEVLEANRLSFSETNLEPGRVLLSLPTGQNGAERLVIATGLGFLAPQSLQLSGKKMLSANDFIRGYREFVGTRLG